MAYNITRLYQDAYNIPYNWERFLPPNMFRYHNLLYQEFNGPVPLQMGILLPFISSLAGPKVKGLWTTEPNVINFFTLNIAASGVGKSQCRKKLISDPIKYVLKNGNPTMQFPDMEVNKYTRAGIEDKLINTKGYAILVSDEGSGFLKDLKNRENKNESDISLLNQLYDGEGDKQTLAKNNQREIPPNSTGISISLQQEAFVNAITNLGYGCWLDTGFSERFMVTAVKPFRHQPQESEKAHEELHSIFGPHLMGKIALGIFQHHYNNEITYCLGKDAKDKYREIVEAYNDQFNLKWSSSQDGNEALDSDDRADICTRSKAPTLIGRLSIILWIYINAFECIHSGKSFEIPTEVSANCVKIAEEIIKTSYCHHETFCSAVFSSSNVSHPTVVKPKKTTPNKVLAAVIRSEGCYVNVQKMCRNLRSLTTKVIKGELQCLEEEGFGKLITRDDMQADEGRGFEKKQAVTIFCKPSPSNLDISFIQRLRDPEMTESFYIQQFRKPTADVKMFPIVKRYHPHLEDLTSSQCGPFNQEMDNDPKQFEELDGIVRTDLFSKKESKTTQISVKSSTVQNENKENIPLKKSDDGKVDSNESKHNGRKQEEQKNAPKKKEKIVNEANFNIVASSSDLFSSVSESCEDKHAGVTVRNVRKTKTKKKKTQSTQVKVRDERGGLTTQDFRDLEADSSFPHSSADLLTNKPTTTQELSISITTETEEKDTTLENVMKKKSADRKDKCGSEIKSKVVSKEDVISSNHNSPTRKDCFVPDTCPPTPNKDDLARAKRKSTIIVSETSPEKSSEKSDGSAEKQRQKRRRRLSLRARNEQVNPIRRSSRLNVKNN